jgi:hypothetical protein
MSDKFDLISAWYKKFVPFTSTNGLRRSPPMGCGLSCTGCETIKAGNGKWKQPRLVAGDDFLDWIEKTLTINARIIASEFLFEAEVTHTV